MSIAVPKAPIPNRTDVKSPEAISETVTVVAHKVVGIIIYSIVIVRPGQISVYLACWRPSHEKLNPEHMQKCKLLYTAWRSK